MKLVDAFGYWLRRIIGQPDAQQLGPEIAPPLDPCGWTQDPTIQAAMSPREFHRFSHYAPTFSPEGEKTVTDAPEPIITGSNRDDRMTALQFAIGYSTANYLDEAALIGLSERMERYLSTGAVPEKEPDPEPGKIETIRSSIFSEAPPAPTQEDPILHDSRTSGGECGGWTRVPGFIAVPNPVYLRAFELALEAAVFKGSVSSLANLTPRASLEQLLTDAKTIGHFLKTGETSIPPVSQARQQLVGSIAGKSDASLQAQMERLRDPIDGDSMATRSSARAQGHAAGYRRGINGGGVLADAEPLTGADYAAIIADVGEGRRDAKEAVEEVIRRGTLAELTRHIEDNPPAKPHDEFTAALDSLGTIGLAAEIGGAIREAVSKRNPYR